jgi:unsaturated rhamnogalacturonyl hydrolase
MISQDTATKIQKYLDYLLANSTAEAPLWNKEKIRSGKPNKWNYIDGCMITAVLSMYELTKDEKYLKFADDFDGWFVQEDGQIKTYDPEEKNLDNLNGARNLYSLYQLTGKEKYRRAMDTAHRQIEIQPRTNAGSFWHKEIYPYQVWLDGLYMAQPFYMQYETELNKMHGCQDSFQQFQNVERLMRDPETGLYYHGYDESRRSKWCSPATGCSKSFWLRSLGWYMASLVETASVMHEALYYEYRYLQDLLKDLADAVLKYQDESGMFYQVIDRCSDEGNYLETSGTALISYALLKGVRLGYLPERYGAAGEKAFQGIVDRYLKIKEDGTINLGGICLVAGLGGEDRRDGTPAYYYSEPVVENEAKGTAPFILAYTEILRRQKQ